MLAGACSTAPRAALPQRLAVLDSLAQVYPCARLAFRVVSDARSWTAPHACGVAGHAVARLAASGPAEPHFGPRDTARIRAIAVGRRRLCVVTEDSTGTWTYRWGELHYYVEIDVPARQRLLTLQLDPVTLRGELGVVHKGWDGSDTLVVLADIGTDGEPGTSCGP